MQARKDSWDRSLWTLHWSFWWCWNNFPMTDVDSSAIVQLDIFQYQMFFRYDFTCLVVIQDLNYFSGVSLKRKVLISWVLKTWGRNPTLAKIKAQIFRTSWHLQQEQHYRAIPKCPVLELELCLLSQPSHQGARAAVTSSGYSQDKLISSSDNIHPFLTTPSWKTWKGRWNCPPAGPQQIWAVTSKE